jgi:delta-aminolevulinic acid dehydratase/porphobilinogen synthase
MASSAASMAASWHSSFRQAAQSASQSGGRHSHSMGDVDARSSSVAWAPSTTGKIGASST